VPRINIGDGEMTGPDGEPFKVKIIEAESIDGIAISVIVQEEAAKNIAAALEGRTITVAKPGDMPPEPEATE